MQRIHTCWLVFCALSIATATDDLGHEATRAYPPDSRLNQASSQSSANDVSYELNTGTMKNEPSRADKFAEDLTAG